MTIYVVNVDINHNSSEHLKHGQYTILYHGDYIRTIILSISYDHLNVYNNTINNKKSKF